MTIVTGASSSSDRAAALLVTADGAVSETCERLAAAAGIPLVTTAEISEAFRGWSAAGLVLVGADRAAALATLAPERRERVCVVGRGGLDEGVWRAAVLLGAAQVIAFPAGESQAASLLAEVGDLGASRGWVVGVVGGSGGIGATTLACALGQVADRPTVVVEVDPLGPGVDRVLGMEERPGVRWGDLAGSRGRLNGRALRESLPGIDGVGVLAFGADATSPEASVVPDVIAALRRGHDTVIVDLPRPGGLHWDEWASRCHRVVVVVDGTVAGVASASRVVAHLPHSGRVVVAARPRAIDAEEVAVALGAPLVGLVPHSRRVAEAIDLGFGPVRSRRDRFGRAMRALWEQVAQ